VSGARAEEPLVLVVVGTDFHRFDRLVGWIDDWLQPRRGTVRCLVQYGTSAAPRVAEGQPYLEYSDVQAALSAASVVVSHGGPATLMQARAHGHLPICVPRDPALGEHVDGHQLRFARYLAAAGMVQLAESRSEFDAAVEATLTRVLAAGLPLPRKHNGEPAQPPAAVARIAELISELTSGALDRSGAGR
jgi:UDP-N-acetylglucosamine transferase subunit ALG13